MIDADREAEIVALEAETHGEVAKDIEENDLQAFQKNQGLQLIHFL